MKLVINGEERSVAEVANLSALIEALEMKADRVAVELNRQIVQRGKWAETTLRDGDRLEIVHFVGGGAICNLEWVIAIQSCAGKRSS